MPLKTKEMSYKVFLRHRDLLTCPICNNGLNTLHGPDAKTKHMVYFHCQSCCDIPFYCDVHLSAYIYPDASYAIRSGNSSCVLCGSMEMKDGVFMMDSS